MFCTLTITYDLVHFTFECRFRTFIFFYFFYFFCGFQYFYQKWVIIVSCKAINLLFCTCFSVLGVGIVIEELYRIGIYLKALHVRLLVTKMVSGSILKLCLMVLKIVYLKCFVCWNMMFIRFAVTMSTGLDLFLHKSV